MSVVGIPSELPILSIINEVVFPGHFVRIAVTNDKGKKLINSLLSKNDKSIGICTVEGDIVNMKTIRKIGVYANITEIKKLIHKPGYLIVARVITRFQIENFICDEPFYKANVKELNEVSYTDEEMIKLIEEFRTLLEKFLKTMQLDSSTIKNLKQVSETTPISTLIDMMAPVWKLSLSEKITLLETTDSKKRLKLTIEHLHKRILTQSKLQKALVPTSSKSFSGLFGNEDDNKELDLLKKKISEIEMPEETKIKVERDLNRLERLKPGASEYDILRTYLEMVSDLPWSKYTEDINDIKKCEEVLDKEHTGLEKVKRRIIEYLSVKKLTKEIRGPILCFHGPPGVGKTSLGKSIAKALGRNFVRISLGGVRDESVIRGHRRTYVGAIAGRIIDGIRRAGTKNPVFLLDEIDKLGSDYKGDPSAALLEVLDPEQNNSFEDHYLGVPFDLSQVLFIATGNEIEKIPPPLLDRMEIVEIPGYTFFEKMKIAEDHLLPKQISLNGLKENQLEIPKDTLHEICTKYTKESGVRDLERLIGSICRFYAAKFAKNEIEESSITVKVEDLENILGISRHEVEPKERLERPGVAIGLAWTPVGGDLLFVECTKMGGKGKLILTGQLGDVIKESAQAALSWIRTNAVKYGLSTSPHHNILDEIDIHIHFPAGSIKKDGPSAGVTILSVLFSILVGKNVRSDTAMTGEITLRGLVLPVGGIKEKVLAAHRAGIKRVLIPYRNKKDLHDVPEIIKQDIEFIFIRTAEKLIENIFFENDVVKPLSFSAL